MAEVIVYHSAYKVKTSTDMESILSAPYFHNEEAAYEFVEARLWPNGPVCPRCGVIGNSAKLKGKSTRAGVYKCRDCRKPFTVKIGTIFEASRPKPPR